MGSRSPGLGSFEYSLTELRELGGEVFVPLPREPSCIDLGFQQNRSGDIGATFFAIFGIHTWKFNQGSLMAADAALRSWLVFTSLWPT